MKNNFTIVDSLLFAASILLLILAMTTSFETHKFCSSSHNKVLKSDVIEKSISYGLKADLIKKENQFIHFYNHLRMNYK